MLLSVLGTLDFGKKVTAIELGRIGTQDNCVGIEGEDCLHPFPVVGRDLISRIAQHRDDVFPESIVRLHHQQFPCFVVHNTRLLGWCQTVAGFSSGRDCIPIETTASSADEYACPSGSAFRTRVVGPLRHKREHCEERALRPFRCLHFPASQLSSLAWDEASLHLST